MNSKQIFVIFLLILCCHSATKRQTNQPGDIFNMFSIAYHFSYIEFITSSNQILPKQLIISHLKSLNSLASSVKAKSFNSNLFQAKYYKTITQIQTAKMVNLQLITNLLELFNLEQMQFETKCSVNFWTRYFDIVKILSRTPFLQNNHLKVIENSLVSALKMIEFVELKQKEIIKSSLTHIQKMLSQTLQSEKDLTHIIVFTKMVTKKMEEISRIVSPQPIKQLKYISQASLKDLQSKTNIQTSFIELDFIKNKDRVDLKNQLTIKQNKKKTNTISPQQSVAFWGIASAIVICITSIFLSNDEL